MDWKTFIATFGALFIAELGDKTQLACVLMTAKTQKPVSTFFGAATALVLVTLLGVLFAHFVCQRIPTDLIKKIASLAFVLIGILMFFDKL